MEFKRMLSTSLYEIHAKQNKKPRLPWGLSPDQVIGTQSLRCSLAEERSLVMGCVIRFTPRMET